jgi:hypothetical protein
MTCSEAKTLMLTRIDEMTKEEAEGLRRHFAGCRECAASMQESKSVFLRLKALRSFEPVLEKAEGLTSDILNSVERARQTRARGLNAFSVHVFGFLSGRAARILYGMFVLTSVCMFLIQQLGVATSVQSLERSMVQRGENGTGIRVVYTVPSSLVNRLPQSEQMRSYVGREETEEQNGNLVIDGRSLSRVVGVVGSAIFRSGNILAGEKSRKSFESIVKALEQSVSARVTIRSKERL